MAKCFLTTVYICTRCRGDLLYKIRWQSDELPFRMELVHAQDGRKLRRCRGTTEKR